MPRRPRAQDEGYLYHVLNRGVGRMRLSDHDADYAAFERVLEETLGRGLGVELLAYTLMPNHRHLVLRTTRDGAMGQMIKWLTTTHAGRYRVAHGQEGIGHLYQGRYKSFIVQDDGHLLTVCRYAERNAAHASLVERAED